MYQQFLIALVLDASVTSALVVRKVDLLVPRLFLEILITILENALRLVKMFGRDLLLHVLALEANEKYYIP